MYQAQFQLHLADAIESYSEDRGKYIKSDRNGHRRDRMVDEPEPHESLAEDHTKGND